MLNLFNLKSHSLTSTTSEGHSNFAKATANKAQSKHETIVSKLCEDKTKTEQETRASETSELIL